VKEMLSLGASKKRIVAKLAGGAQMFTFTQGAELSVSVKEMWRRQKANWRVSTFP